MMTCLRLKRPLLISACALATLCLPAAAETAARRALMSAPVTFERNVGQAAAEVDFLARAPGYALSLSADSLKLRLAERKGTGVAEFEMALTGASPEARAEGLDPAPRSTHYFLGADPRRWISAAPHYSKVRYRGIYRGIDILYYQTHDGFEYDFELAAGADPAAIELRFTGWDELRLTPEGDLIVRAGSVVFRQRKPYAYQILDSGTVEVEARYRLGESGRVGFLLGGYDRSAPLTIDPRVGLSSYLGGVFRDSIRGVTMLADDGIWLAGSTDSPNFPIPPGAFPENFGGGSDAFAVKLAKKVDDEGRARWEIVTTVFLGGDNRDRAVAIEVDDEGRLYVFGDTRSGDFPVSGDAAQSSLGGRTDLFLTVLRETDFPFLRSIAPPNPEQPFASNYEILYSTFHGGSEDEEAQGGLLGPLAESPKPCAVLYGLTESADFPTSIFPIQKQKGAAADGVMAAYCQDPTDELPFSRSYATFLGGGRPELGVAAAVARNGSFCMALKTPSSSLPANGYSSAPIGGNDIYITCWRPTRRSFGLPFLYREIGSTYFGGSENETLAGLVLLTAKGAGPDDPFYPTIAVTSDSEDIPISESVALPPATGFLIKPGERSILVVSFDSALKQVKSQFWMGGSTVEEVRSITSEGPCIGLAGRSASTDLPVSSTFPQTQNAGGFDAFAAKICFDTAGDFSGVTEYSGFYGSADSDLALRLAFGPNGDEILVGVTGEATLGGDIGVAQSANSFPVTEQAPQTSFGGGVTDGFVVEFFRPVLEARAIVGAADFRSRSVAAGEILSLFGRSIGPEKLAAAEFDAAGRLKTRLGSTRVLFDGVAAPMVFAARNQVSAIAPFSLTGKVRTIVQVEVDGAASVPLELPVAPTAPQVFSANQSGTGQGAILNQNFTPNSAANPAVPGSIIQIFLTGGGQTAPRGVDGELIPLSPPFPRLLAPVTVRIGGVLAATPFFGGAPGLVHGVVQINAFVPDSLAPNPETPIEITIGGETTQPGITLAVGSVLGR